MRFGGMFDHLGFGFHRYSTDPQWLLPHFEKMLYDQAMLAMAYRGLSGNRRPALCAHREGDLRPMSAGPDLAARRLLLSRGCRQRGPGRQVLRLDRSRDRGGSDPEEAALAIRLQHRPERGNFREEHSRGADGPTSCIWKWIPRRPEASTARPGCLNGFWRVARTKLFLAREKRVRPGIDSKILTDWNGLMIAALARRVGRPRRPRDARPGSRGRRLRLEGARR